MREFLEDQGGAAALEYIIVAAAAIFALTAVILGLFNAVKAKLQGIAGGL
jgi:Flp pilus assembly pilin Flp